LIFIVFIKPYGLRRGRALAAIAIVAASGSMGLVLAADGPPPAASAPASGNATVAAGNSSVADANSQIPADTDLNRLAGFLRQSVNDPEGFATLIKTLEDLNKIPPAERQAMLLQVTARMQNIRQINTALRAEMAPLSNADKNVLGRYLATLYPQEDPNLKLLQSIHDATTTEQRKKIVTDLLTAAAAKGIKPRLDIPDSGPPGGGPRGNPPSGNRSPNGSGRGANGPSPRGERPMPSPAKSAPASDSAPAAPVTAGTGN
jgi:hypothetical protein